MAIPMSDIRSRFIRYTPGATLSRDDGARFMDYDEARKHGRVDIGQQGYNAQNPSTRINRVRLDTDNVTLRSR